MTPELSALVLVFAPLSLMAVGGPSAILVEMHRQVVDLHAWMRPDEFTMLFGIAQSAPGPNMMVASLIGWRVSGWPGFAVASLAIFVPSSLAAYWALSFWDRLRQAPWRAPLLTALAPLTAGLSMAGAAIVTLGAARDLVLAAIALAAVLVLSATRLHPLAVLAGGGLAAALLR